jgi:hypothetical protein
LPTPSNRPADAAERRDPRGKYRRQFFDNTGTWALRHHRAAAAHARTWRMADMTGFDPQWLGALVLLVTALFIAVGLPIAPEWRRRLKAASIGLFFLALVVVLMQIAVWLFAGSG